ncbi:hypothetical protein N0V91_001919 [Didymella pomorum]|uniref:Uncharacterized protein n=1 Tax=Didymella pomorum TaxID=749634 RepID=A0A9W8ZNA9_9PLEO|nr:hypothetical protein N0V91_001919 [Didymella pomorum]
MALQLPPIFITLQPALILTTNVLTLAIGPQHRVLQFAFSVPALFILAAQSLYRDWDRGWGLHYGLNCFVMTSLVTWVDWILLNNPYKEQWVKLEQRKGAETLGKETVRATESPEFPKDDGGVVRNVSAEALVGCKTGDYESLRQLELRSKERAWFCPTHIPTLVSSSSQTPPPP